MEFSECLQPVMVESEYEGFGCEDELPDDCVFAEAIKLSECQGEGNPLSRLTDGRFTK